MNITYRGVTYYVPSEQDLSVLLAYLERQA